MSVFLRHMIRSINELVDLLKTLGFDVIDKSEERVVLRRDCLTLEVVKGDKEEMGLVSVVSGKNRFNELRELVEKKFKKKVSTKSDREIVISENNFKIIISQEPRHVVYKMLGDKLLLTRRSIRYFQERDVPEDVLWKIFEICRFSPTSKNSQSYYFIVIKDKETLKWLASLRGQSSTPIGRAPMAVAICSDPDKSRRHIQDGVIAAYHFMLAAWFYGLGTCWIAAMDRDDVKDKLGIPKHHYVATITPLGYPEFIPEPPPRKPAKEFVKFFQP